MATTTRIERRKRGIVGWFFLILFWGFNALMAFALFSAIAQNAASYEALTNDASRAGYAAGTAIGASMVFIMWVFGAILLGLFVMITRGNKVIVETNNG